LEDEVDLTSRVCECVAKALNRGEKEVSIDSSIENLENWDSLGQLLIIMQIEEAFKVRFRTREIPELTSVRKLVEKIGELLSAKK
jgi:acyl carrier protein